MEKKKKQEYMVECKISGTALVYVEAYSDEEAIAAARNGEGEIELSEWEPSEFLGASPTD